MSSHTILLVEDDAAISYAIEHALRKIHKGQVVVVRSGEEAVSYLRQVSASRMPTLILLDVRLPGQSGLRVLDTIRRELGLTRIPVVLLTVVTDRESIVEAYEIGANSYLVKPDSPEGWDLLFKGIERYWLSHNVAV